MFNSSTFNNTSPIFYMDNALSFLDYDMNLNSKQEEPLYSPSYYHLPSPLIYNDMEYFGDFLSHNSSSTQQFQALKAASSAVTDDSSIFEVTNKMGCCSNNKLIGEDQTVYNSGEVVEEDHNNNENNIKIRPISGSSSQYGSSRRRRTSKKDRHSKINTAHGLRDRRMRLSLEVARRFFKLQDMLNFDKASRTVEWLLMQSKPAIEELFQAKKLASPSGVTKCTMSSTSDCEVESMIVEESRNKGNNSKEKRGSSSTSVKDKNKGKRKRKGTTRESRTEARARARKRTLERMQSRDNQLKDDDDKACKMVSWGGFEMVGGFKDSISQTYKGGNNNNNNNSIEVQNHADCSLTTGKWNPLTSFSYQQNGEISQSVPSYRHSMQQNIMGGPPK